VLAFIANFVRLPSLFRTDQQFRSSEEVEDGPDEQVMALQEEGEVRWW
jgi:hypothetical protein